jgi:outer membrane protein assembly factor BamB
VDFTNKVEPIIVKVDPATGRVLWRVEKVGDKCYLAGKHLFVTRTQVSNLDMISALSKGGGNIPTNFRLYRLNPRNGKEVWEFYRPSHPMAMDFRDNEILFQFNDKLEILKFLSL